MALETLYCLCTNVCIHVCTCGGHRSDVFLNTTSLPFCDGLFTYYLELTDVARPANPRNLPAFACLVLVLQAHTAAPSLLRGCWRCELRPSHVWDSWSECSMQPLDLTFNPKKDAPLRYKLGHSFTPPRGLTKGEPWEPSSLSRRRVSCPFHRALISLC